MDYDQQKGKNDFIKHIIQIMKSEFIISPSIVEYTPIEQLQSNGVVKDGLFHLTLYVYGPIKRMHLSLNYMFLIWWEQPAMPKS